MLAKRMVQEFHFRGAQTQCEGSGSLGGATLWPCFTTTNSTDNCGLSRLLRGQWCPQLSFVRGPDFARQIVLEYNTFELASPENQYSTRRAAPNLLW